MIGDVVEALVTIMFWPQLDCSSTVPLLFARNWRVNHCKLAVFLLAGNVGTAVWAAITGQRSERLWLRVEQSDGMWADCCWGWGTEPLAWLSETECSVQSNWNYGSVAPGSFSCESTVWFVMSFCFYLWGVN